MFGTVKVDLGNKFNHSIVKAKRVGYFIEPTQQIKMVTIIPVQIIEARIDKDLLNCFCDGDYKVLVLPDQIIKRW